MAVSAFAAMAILLAGFAFSFHADDTAETPACDTCATACVCNDVSDLHRTAAISEPALAVVGFTDSDADRLASGAAAPIFIPPRT